MYSGWKEETEHEKLCWKLGIDPQTAAGGLCALAGVPGRMELIDMGQPFTAVVDFAHTPNALKVALQTGREMTEGRVISVFGSAGLRDKEKRRLMAEISAELADLTILTAEDPRVDPLNGILEEMAQGAEARGGVENVTFWRIRDRGEAVRVVLQSKRGSASRLQRALSVGYTRASRLMDRVTEEGILGAHRVSKSRRILVSLEDWEASQEETVSHGTQHE